LLRESRVNAYTVKPRPFDRIVPTLVLRSCSFSRFALAPALPAPSAAMSAIAAIAADMRFMATSVVVAVALKT
jgi:hypothetical protein